MSEFLAKKQPIHFGGMADPFPPMERRTRTSLEILKILADFQYPTVISTKNAVFADDDYLDILSRGNFMIQASISSADDGLIQKIDLGASGPSALLKALQIASGAGIRTAMRIQPLIPSREEDAEELIALAPEVGVRHVAVEHLKVPIEKSWQGGRTLEGVLGTKFLADYERHGIRVGREWILPVQMRLPTILDLRAKAHQVGLSFGAADNDLLLLGDGECCCSGADLYGEDFGSYFKCTYAHAARQGIHNGEISIDTLSEEWRPTSSIARFVNSRSRLVSEGRRGGGVWDYLKRNWNGSPNGNAPDSFYGVDGTSEKDDQGFVIYTASDELRDLVTSP